MRRDMQFFIAKNIKNVSRLKKIYISINIKYRVQKDVNVVRAQS